MAEPLVTKIACDCAEKSNTVLLLTGTCPFCRNSGRMPVKTALRRAEAAFVVATGMYIESDITVDELHAKQAACERVYALAGVMPPWKEKADG